MDFQKEKVKMSVVKELKESMEFKIKFYEAKSDSVSDKDKEYHWGIIRGLNIQVRLLEEYEKMILSESMAKLKLLAKESEGK